MEPLLFNYTLDLNGTTHEEVSTNTTADNAQWDAEETDDALMEAYLEEMAPSAGSNPFPLAFEPDAFVNFFATVNVFKLTPSFKQNDPVKAAKVVASGNSRAAPTPFLLHYGAGQCEYKTWNYAVLQSIK